MPSVTLNDNVSKSEGKLEKALPQPIFNKEYAKLIKADVEKDSMLQKLASNMDDYVVDTLPPPRNLLPAHIAVATKIELAQPAKDVVAYLTGERTNIKFKSVQFGKYPVVDHSKVVSSEPLVYDVDHEAPATSDSKPQLTDLFSQPAKVQVDEQKLDQVAIGQKYRGELRIINRDLKADLTKQPPRMKMVDLFGGADEDYFDSRVDQNIDALHNMSKKARKFDIQVKSLAWTGTPCQVDGEMFFIDLSSKARITEAFKFQSAKLDTVCTFRLSNPTSDTVLVVLLDKQYEGDLSDWLDAYGKGKDKGSTAVGSYKQCLGWTAVNMFEDEEFAFMKVSDKPTEYTTDSLYKPDDKFGDEDICQQLLTMRSKANAKKLKQVPVKVSLSIIEAAYASKDRTLSMEEFTSNTYNVSLQPRHHLYCWLESLNITKGSSAWKNVAVKVQLMEIDHMAEQKPVQSLFKQGGDMVTEYVSSIAYHNRQPYFADEIKIALPLPLDKKHHLLFTFHHISYTHKKEDALIGYSFLPLYRQGDVFESDGSHHLAIFHNLADNYVDFVGPDSKAFDQGKPAFTIRLRLQSSFYTQEPKLARLFRTLNSKASVDETELGVAIKELSTVDPLYIATFMPTIADNLIGIMCNSDNKVLQKNAFMGLLGSVSAVHGDSLRGHQVVVDYIKSHMRLKKEWKKQPFEQIVTLWREVCNDNGQASKDAFKYGWVFLEAIAKFCILSVVKSKAQVNERSKLFGKSFAEELDNVIADASAEVYRLAKSGLNVAKDLNESLASFCNKMLYCFDVDTIYRWIANHVHGFDSSLAVNVNLKFDFLKIVCAHEHLVTISLPLKYGVLSELSAIHFIPFLLVNQVVQGMKLATEDMRLRGFQTLQDVLLKLESDTRFADVEKQARMFQMFGQFVVSISQNVNRLTDSQNSKALKASEVRSVLISIGVLFKYLDKRVLFKYMEKDAESRKATFNLVCALNEQFEYSGKFIIMEQASLTTPSPSKGKNQSAMQYIENAYKGTQGSSNLRELRGTLKKQALMVSPQSKVQAGSQRFSSINDAVTSGNMPADIQNMVKLASLSCHETSLNTIDFLNEYCDVARLLDSKKALTTEQAQEYIQAILHVMSSTMSNGASDRFLKLLGRVLQNFFTYILQSNQLTSGVCSKILPFMSSNDDIVRCIAAEVVYVLMRFNLHQTKHNISKTRVQLTVALSGYTSTNPLSLKLALLLVQDYCNIDAQAPKTLQTLVSNCITSLTAILKDNIRLSIHSDDPEMQEDMYHKLALSYSHTPDLRLSMLEALATQHCLRNQFAEAAFCKLHCSVMVAEFLKHKKKAFGGPTSGKSFKGCSVSLADEVFISADTFNHEDEGICESPKFSSEGLLELLMTAASLFRKGNLHETAVEVFKLVTGIYEHQRNYEQLLNTYTAVKECYETIINTMGKRILATFFRVSFFGQQFGQLNGQHYIYKEKSVTQLSEIVGRLTDLYKKKYGASFELINDSGKLDSSKLDPKKAYLAVVHVEPYFEDSEAGERISYFDKMTNLKQFVFDMPYTLQGGARGEVDTQYKRKTILTTEAAFPYIKKRLLISNVREISLDPIEVSIEAIGERVDKMKGAVEQKPLNLKNLQLLLQGIVRATVNKGPLEIAVVFIENKANAAKYKKEKVDLLKNKFLELADLCHRGVVLSKEVSPPDQEEYNDDLELGYNTMKQKLDEIFGVAPPVHADK